MNQNNYLFIYERLDGSSFQVLNRLSDDDLAIETGKLALSKHHDLKSCSVLRADLLKVIQRELP